MSSITRAEQATLVAMRCRTAERSPASAPGVEEAPTTATDRGLSKRSIFRALEVACAASIMAS